jgi:hypothetical protein
MNSGFNAAFQTTDYFPSWKPSVTSINMNGVGGTNDCIAYINKLAYFGSNYSPGQLIISASEGGYSNTNWYSDNDGYGLGTSAAEGVSNVDPSASIFITIEPGFAAEATNVAGYFTCGWDCDGAFTPEFATNGAIQFFGDSGWYIMATIDSYSGQRMPLLNTNQWSFLTWFATNSFGGTNYSNTAVGAVSYVDEPGGQYGEVATSVYYGDWAAGKSFGISAWAAQVWAEAGPPYEVYECQVVGDPFVRR